ncbi:coiled-coil domain-containing protein 17 [Electrophorus electricus]|uniref:coiled-coil domain-containing protein 17 n=1 Tax=Electrophorus electricus TaxID=8005 RepID=UPI0015D04F2B|nr:coiled-coil domain-containing protein 17 [Electrophorus electricus]
MEHSGELCCRDCNMEFNSASLLDKHKARFCTGSILGDPMAFRKIQVEITKPEKTALGFPSRKTQTPDLICLREQRKKLVRQRDSPESHPQRSTAEGLPLSQLTEEFYKLRMSVEENELRRQTQGLGPGSQCLNKERLQEVSEHHGQKLAEIKAYTHHLERQREDIEQHLMGFSGKGSMNYPEKVLQDLKKQELRNEEFLCQLSTQLNRLWGMKEGHAHSELLKDKKTQHFSFEPMFSVDGLVSTQIRSLRLAYVQAGGADPEVLAHMHDLQAEAYVLEQVTPRAEHKSGKKREWNSSDIWVVERENQKLEEEILRMQLARERCRGNEAGSESHPIQRRHIDEIASLQAEVFSLRREVDRGREGQALVPLPTFSGRHLAQIKPTDYSSKQHSLMGMHVLDPKETLGPAPYDSTAGFIIFYDIVLGVDATFRTLRLVARLYIGGQEMEWPTRMPPVQCHPAGALTGPLSTHSGNYALLAVKQPVLRMQPSPALSLVVEVQATGGLGSYSEKESQEPVPQGWARLLLFDEYNQFQSGFWRVPFRCLPVMPSLGTDQLNPVPQLGDMEICLRVVNARDGDIQSLAKIDPNNTGHYKHPPEEVSQSATVLAGQTHLITLQHSSSPFLSSQPQNDWSSSMEGEFTQARE